MLFVAGNDTILVLEGTYPPPANTHTLRHIHMSTKRVEIHGS